MFGRKKFGDKVNAQIALHEDKRRLINYYNRIKKSIEIPIYDNNLEEKGQEFAIKRNPRGQAIYYLLLSILTIKTLVILGLLACFWINIDIVKLLLPA